MMNDTAGDNCMVLFINLGGTSMPVTNNDPRNSPEYSQDMEQPLFRPDTGLRKLRYENLITEKSETVGFNRKLSRTLDETQIFILTSRQHTQLHFLFLSTYLRNSLKSSNSTSGTSMMPVSASGPWNMTVKTSLRDSSTYRWAPNTCPRDPTRKLTSQWIWFSNMWWLHSRADR